jgi:cellobiose-specific phosphotransferase system component IIC
MTILASDANYVMAFWIIVCYVGGGGLALALIFALVSFLKRRI